VIVQGGVQGDIRGVEAVTIEPSARVNGNIYAPRIGLKEGAKFKGSIDMDPDAPAKAAEKAAAKAAEQAAAKAAEQAAAKAAAEQAAGKSAERDTEKVSEKPAAKAGGSRASGKSGAKRRDSKKGEELSDSSVDDLLD
jgi:hypothetical protein